MATAQEGAPWIATTDETISVLRTSLSQGLSTEEVNRRREKYGTNELQKEPGEMFFQVAVVYHKQAGKGVQAELPGDIPPVGCFLLLLLSGSLLPAAGTPLWKLVLSQFDDMLVKVGLCISCMQPAAGMLGHVCSLTHRGSSWWCLPPC